VKGPFLTVPNLLTLARAAAAVPVAIAILDARFGLALVLVVLAGMTDGIDGLVARRTGQLSDVGRLLDPIADKLLLVTIFVTICIPDRGFEPLPLWVAALAIGRDSGIVLAGAVIYAVTGFSGFTPTFFGKLNTVMELWLVVLFLATRASLGVPEALLTASIYATAASIVGSGLHYVVHARRQLAQRASGLRVA
jgi:cardiolipin synthase